MRFSRLLGAVALIALACPLAHAQTVNLAYWDFNDITTGSAVNATTRTELFSVDGGLHSATAAMSSSFFATDGTTAGGSKTGITDFSGTNLNAGIPGVGTVTAGQALALQGFGGNGSFLRFDVDTTGFDTIKVSYATRGTNTGFNNDQFQYSTDGVSFTNFSSAYDPRGSTFGLAAFDLSSIAGLSDNALASFRIVFNGATSDLGNNRIDNLQVGGVKIGGLAAAPEPGALALLLPCLGGFVVARRRNGPKR